MAVYEKQVRLPADVLQELGDHSGRWWSDPALEPIIVEAIRAFANGHGSGNRNAWKAVWLRFPGSEQWLLADVCRAQQSAAIARLFGGDGQTLHRATPPHPAPASRVKRAGKLHSKPKQRTASSSSVEQTVHRDGDQRKHGAARAARRKRRAQKHVSAKP